ncbi:MAG TPA: dihydrofolate reductase family protein [Gaiellaceae bacterium]|nr:dihydrofolate reductase family protein [Gaiellaceae bacterium]
MSPALEPFDVLFEEEGLPGVELPAALRRIYRGDLGFREPCLYANFVSTVDGVIAIPALPGSNEAIAAGSEGDRFLMGLLRAFADIVLIGAGVLKAAPRGTWQPEKVYPAGADAFGELRRLLGRSAAPEVAVLTGSGSIDPGHPLLATGALVLTSRPGAGRLAPQLPAASRLLALGEETLLDGHVVVDALRERGHRLILSEAGPHVFGSLLEAKVVDELFLTISPLLAGDAGAGSRLRLVEAADLVPLLAMTPLSLRRHEQHLFARYGLARCRRTE